MTLGVVSLIAANWDEISPKVKIFCYFLCYTSLAAAIVAYYRTKPFLSEICRGLFFGLTLAGIGLIAQIFHIQSDGWSGFLFWTMVTFPVVLLSRQAFLPGAWWGAYYLSISLWTFIAKAHDIELRACAFAALVLIPTLLSPLLPKLTRGHFLEFSAPCRKITWLILWFLSPLFLDIFANMGSRDITNGQVWWRLSGVIFVFFSLHMGIIYLETSRKDFSIRVTQMASMGTPLFLWLAWAATGGAFLRGEIGGGIQFILIMTAASIFAHKMAWRTLFNLATLCLALRLIVIYFQVFGSLLSMGFGLIVSGLFILAIAYGWHRLRVFSREAGRSKEHE